MNRQELEARLREDEIVVLETAAWQAIANTVRVLEQHDTLIKGMLTIIDTSVGPAAVEEPSTNVRVIRRLRDTAAVRAFIEERLKVYERMWDGCGCKVDYFT